MADYGTGESGILDNIKGRISTLKNNSTSTVTNVGTNVDSVLKDGIAIITPEDGTATKAVTSFKDDVVDQLESKFGGSSIGSLSNSIQGYAEAAQQKIMKFNEEAASTRKGIQDKLNGTTRTAGSGISDVQNQIQNTTVLVNKYKQISKGYEQAVKSGKAGDYSKFGKILGIEKSTSSLLAGFGVRNFGKGSGGFRDNLADNVNDIYRYLTGKGSSSILVKDGKGNIKLSGDKDNPLLTAVSALTGWAIGDEYLDAAIKSSLLQGLISDGLDKLIQPVIDKFLNAEDADKVLIKLADHAIKKGDIKTIRSILNGLSKDSARRTLFATYPTAPMYILKGFKFKKDDTTKDYDELRDLILSYLVSFGGENWMYAKGHEDKQWYNLSYTKISNDAKTLLTEVPALRPMLYAEGNFKIMSASKVFFNHFPKTPVLKY